MLTLADFPGEIIGPLCFGCWVLPFILIGLPFALLRGIGAAWRQRGLEKGGLY